MPISEIDVRNALPAKGWLRDYVLWAEQRTDAHAAYHVGVGLSLLTQTLNLQMITRFGGMKIIPNLFVLLVGDSSDARKGACVELGKEILDVAVPGAALVQPSSAQALIAQLHNQKRHLAVYGEFGKFVAQTEQGPAVVLKTTLNEAYDGTELGNALAAEVRSKTGKGPVKDYRLSMLAGCAPELLEEHTKEVDWTSGFYARFFMLNCTRIRDWTQPTDDAIGRDRLADKLMSMEQLSANCPPGKHLGLTPEAQLLWNIWQAQTGARKILSLFPAGITRSGNMVRKISILLAADYGGILNGADWYTSLDELFPAIRLTELHIQSVIEMSMTISPNPDMQMRKKVLNAIDDKPTPLAKILSRAQMKMSRVMEMVAHLMAEKRIAQVHIGADHNYWQKIDVGATHVGTYIPPTLPSEQDLTDAVRNGTEDALKLKHTLVIDVE